MKKIPLNGKHGKGKFALVDDEDYEELMKYKWYVSSTGYPTRGKRENGIYKSIRLHRVILKPKKGLFVDHINHDKLDNRKVNLRECTKSQNAANVISERGICKFKGVDYIPKTKKFRATIHKNYKKINIGFFTSAIEAAKAYNAKAKELFGEFAYLNKV